MIETLTELVPAQAIAEFPVSTFLESIVIDTNNNLFITSHYEGKVFRIGADGVIATHATIAGKATGLLLTPDGELLLSDWNEKETSVIWHIASDGTVELLTELPEAIFLNGLTRLNDDNYLIADSYRGAIWELNVPTKTVRNEDLIRCQIEHRCVTVI